MASSARPIGRAADALVPRPADAPKETAMARYVSALALLGELHLYRVDRRRRTYRRAMARTLDARADALAALRRDTDETTRGEETPC